MIMRLGREVQLHAFTTHAYRSEIIGELEDLKSISRDDLYHHYHTYYQPNNAQICLAGDFNSSTMLKKLARLYQDMPPGPPPPHPAQPEPPPQGEKRVEVKGPGETTFIQMAYRAPAASHPDFFALSVLDSLLTGPSSLNMFGGGGVSNKTSRLYQALVEKEYTVGVEGGLSATIDPYLYEITLTVHPDKTPEMVFQAIDQEIQRLLEHKVTDVEVLRAIKQARALFAYGTENITNQAFWLGYADMFESYTWFEEYVQRLEKISPDDVLRAAQTYLSPSNRVIGIYIPDQIKEKTE